MAEYYPLISRAVAGMRTSTPEARQGIYDRARQALIGQLRAMDPPVPEDAIARETVALDEAIARVERETVAAGGGAPAPAPAPPARPTLKSRIPPPPPPVKRAAPALGGMQRGEEAETPPPGPPRRPAAALRDDVDADQPRPPAPQAGEPLASPSPDEAPVLPAAPTLSVEPIGPRAGHHPATSAVPARDGDEDAASESPTTAAADKGRDEAMRPAAPRPIEKRRPDLRLWIVAGVALVAVVAIGVTAWRLRDSPQELARAPAVVVPTETPAGKIAERADGAAPAGSEPETGVVVASDQATQAAKEPAAAPPPATSGPTASQVATTTATAPASSPAPTSDASADAATTADLAIPVAYKAAILVDAPDTPEKVRTYVGTVVWRSTSVPQGQGQPLATEIEARIDVPDAKVQLTFQLRRNTEAQLPASHTIDLKFTVAADSPLGSIKQINVPQMRQPDQPTGDPLAGIPVTIADNYFLIGLMRGAAEERNLELLRARQWFDIPMLLANGKASKITFEKGASGTKIFNAVLDGWKNAQN